METKGWDVFRVLPPETDSSSENIQKWLKNAVKILKVFAYLFTFCMVLVCGVVTKITTLFMTSQIKLNKETEYCNHALERGKDYVARISTQERVAWTWCIFFAFIIPELGRTHKGGIIFLHYNPHYHCRHSLQISQDLCLQVMQTILLLGLLRRSRLRDDAHHRTDSPLLRGSARAGRGEGRHADQLCLLHTLSIM